MVKMAILNLNTKVIWITNICLLVASVVTAQQTKKLEGVKGEWVVSNDITITQARENAINQAKVEALRLAGVPEYVSESNLTYKTEKEIELKELHQSLTTVDVTGEISEFKVINEEKKVNEFGNVLYTVWINATVTIHESSKDPGFNIEVKGIHESYSSPDKLVFEIKPWKEGYLTVFILSENESGQLFPNRLEKQEKLEAQKTYVFPKSKALDYEVTTESGVEVNYLLLLYTKNDIPFLMEQTSENILKFIATIAPSEKCLKSYSLLIKK
jgi:hypothetical protein